MYGPLIWGLNNIISDEIAFSKRQSSWSVFFFYNEDKLLYDKKKKEKWCNMESIGQHGPPVGFE